MADDTSRLTDINAHPTYHASLRLASGTTVRNGDSVGGRMTADEAGEVATMLRAAERLA